MAEQVEKLLQMTRLENGAIRLSRDWAAVSEMVDAALSRLSARLSAHRVVVDISENLPLLRVDAILVDQALVNLLENAAKHTAAGTLVHVRARQVDNQIRISVEDFGPGIDENNLELVFAKFQHGANEHTAGGVGLGLAITRTIVSLHGGRTWAERIPGGGTAFHFTLPLEEVPRPPAEATHG
jgi:two-component system sensor histidine kinase KdpD